MLAYMIVRRLRKAWESFDLTVKDGIGQLATVCSMEVKIKGQDVEVSENPTATRTISSVTGSVKK